MLGLSKVDDKDIIGHVINIPSMQLLTGISRNTQSNSYMLSLTECVWEFRNNALWDTLLNNVSFMCIRLNIPPTFFSLLARVHVFVFFTVGS